VIIADIDADAAAERAEHLRGIGVTATPIGCDIGDHASVDAAIERALEEVDEISILVNNAGIRRDRTLAKMSDEEWDETVNVDLRGAFYCCRAVLPHMPAGDGRIVSMSSRLFLGNFGSTNYSAAKAGLIGMSRSLALEVAAKGITVNVIAPGTIETPGVAAFRADAPEAYERFMSSVPFGRPGQPEDIAALVEFLTGPDAGYITGQTIFVCGGWSIGGPAW
jgi:3-oxoacyl-[acyl-carrier protein] reductase